MRNGVGNDIESITASAEQRIIRDNVQIVLFKSWRSVVLWCIVLDSIALLEKPAYTLIKDKNERIL